MDYYHSLHALADTMVIGEQSEWIVLILGLFHLMINYMKMIIRNYVRSTTGDDDNIFFIWRYNMILCYEQINSNTVKFWPGMQLLEDICKGYILLYTIEDVQYPAAYILSNV